MRLCAVKPSNPQETRSPLTSEVAKKLIDMGVEVAIEPGIGAASHDGDEAFREAGVFVYDSRDALWEHGDVVLALESPRAEDAGRMKDGAILVGMLAPLQHPDLVRRLVEHRATAFSMEFLPRISRAQSMDVLSSQANLGGYKAVTLAAEHCPKAFPMMITAAGTISPAKVFVLGAGVAGLQAIATAKRLGAVVEAFDVRAATREQVQSLGARFVRLPTAAQDDKASGGYAKEQTEEERQKQAELMAKHVVGADVVITTAAVFGKAPPMLIPADVVSGMRSGSVIVDTAASPEHGRGNCEATHPGETYTTANGVTIVGLTNLPGLLPMSASKVYANNMLAFISEWVKDGEVSLNLEDEVQAGACITHAGDIRNELVKTNLGS